MPCCAMERREPYWDLMEVACGVGPMMVAIPLFFCWLFTHEDSYLAAHMMAVYVALSTPNWLLLAHDLLACFRKPSREAGFENYRRPTWQKTAMNANYTLCSFFILRHIKQDPTPYAETIDGTMKTTTPPVLT
ncbi:unnamed protein product [Cladocopium goreaui]|uniref:Uncharacterized protein n=1 Tax=Cladocopium goreaui TaxID=2562237 RepID=A0A9P1G1A6_9DINO|nr:unnamed protein product [Cladocopium goreaui]